MVDLCIYADNSVIRVGYFSVNLTYLSMTLCSPASSTLLRLNQEHNAERLVLLSGADETIGGTETDQFELS